MNNIIPYTSVPDQFSKAGGIKVLLSLINRGLKGAYTPALNTIREITASSGELAAQVNDAGFAQICVKILNKPDKVPVDALANAVLTE